MSENKAMFSSELEHYIETGERLTDTFYVKGEILSRDEVYDFFDIGDAIDFDIARAIKSECADEKTEKWARSFPMEFAY